MLQEVWLIFGDHYLIFHWQGTKDVCVHQVILCDIYSPAKPEMGQDSYSQLT